MCPSKSRLCCVWDIEHAWNRTCIFFRGKNTHASRPHHCPSGPGGHDGCHDVLAAHKNQNNTKDLEFTMSKLVADQIAETLKAAGVKRIYGIVGDSLNGITDALRTSGIEWVHVRHEEVAAFAAGAEAHLTGTIAVCAGSCGPGNLHLINGLFDCHRNRVPVLRSRPRYHRQRWDRVIFRRPIRRICSVSVATTASLFPGQIRCRVF